MMRQRSLVNSFLARRRVRAFVRSGGAASAALVGALVSFAPAAAAATAGNGPGVTSTSTSASRGGSALAGVRLYVNPSTDARRQADAWRKSRPADAAMMERIAAQPVATWFGDWNRDVRRDVDAVVSAGAAQSAMPVLVAYDI